MTTTMSNNVTVSAIAKTLSKGSKPKSPATTGPGHVFSKFVSKVTVRSQKSLKLPLGNTFTGMPPKGFSIILKSKDLDDSVDMQVVTAGTPKKYEYLLRLTNNSTRPVVAEVWQM